MKRFTNTMIQSKTLSLILLTFRIQIFIHKKELEIIIISSSLHYSFIY